MGESSLNSLLSCDLLVSSSQVCPGRFLRCHPALACGGAVLFPHLSQLRTGNFLLFSALLEGSGLGWWVGCGWAHGLGAECHTQVPHTTLAGAAEQSRESCVVVVFYDHYLDKSQLHSGVMLIIVSTKLDLLSLPPLFPLTSNYP